MSKENRIKEAFQENQIILSESQQQQFQQYYDLLIEWNQFMNLTAITEFEEVIQKHFIDSIAIGRILDLKDFVSLIDVGTGAGFPGIPLKIVYPQLRITLLDSLNKRVQFLNAVIEKLNLTDITAVHGRAEDYAKREEYREQFELCVSRAVANLASLSEYCLPFVKSGGFFISYKSGKIEEELEAAEKAIMVLGGKVNRREDFLLSDSDIFRSLLQIEKIKETPKKYPRKAGMPTKEPIR